MSPRAKMRPATTTSANGARSEPRLANGIGRPSRLNGPGASQAQIGTTTPRPNNNQLKRPWAAIATGGVTRKARAAETVSTADMTVTPASAVGMYSNGMPAETPATSRATTGRQRAPPKKHVDASRNEARSGGSKSAGRASAERGPRSRVQRTHRCAADQVGRVQSRQGRGSEHCLTGRRVVIG